MMGEVLFEAFIIYKEMTLFGLYKQQSCKNNSAGCVQGGGDGEKELSASL